MTRQQQTNLNTMILGAYGGGRPRQTIPSLDKVIVPNFAALRQREPIKRINIWPQIWGPAP